MTNFDYNDYVSATKIVANKAKVIADAFAHEYIDHVDHVTVAMIESNPDSYNVKSHSFSHLAISFSLCLCSFSAMVIPHVLLPDFLAIPETTPYE